MLRIIMDFNDFLELLEGEEELNFVDNCKAIHMYYWERIMLGVDYAKEINHPASKRRMMGADLPQFVYKPEGWEKLILPCKKK